MTNKVAQVGCAFATHGARRAWRRSLRISPTALRWFGDWCANGQAPVPGLCRLFIDAHSTQVRDRTACTRNSYWRDIVKNAVRWKPPTSALQRDCASGLTAHPDIQEVANGLPLNAAERPPNRTALRALGGHRTLRWRNPGALACCACFRRFTILIERDRWAGGGHLIWARSQPLGLMWVGGGAEPTSLWYGPACANFALREIGPKDKHGE